jgi:hypothetical protein
VLLTGRKRTRNVVSLMVCSETSVWRSPLGIPLTCRRRPGHQPPHRNVHPITGVAVEWFSLPARR